MLHRRRKTVSQEKSRKWDPTLLPGLLVWVKAVPKDEGGCALVDMLTGRVLRSGNEFSPEAKLDKLEEES
jgi:hypothetical protein